MAQAAQPRVIEPPPPRVIHQSISSTAKQRRSSYSPGTASQSPGPATQSPTSATQNPGPATQHSSPATHSTNHPSNLGAIHRFDEACCCPTLAVPTLAMPTLAVPPLEVPPADHFWGAHLFHGVAPPPRIHHRHRGCSAEMAQRDHSCLASCACMCHARQTCLCHFLAAWAAHGPPELH